jgi:hypothetical protein
MVLMWHNVVMMREGERRAVSTGGSNFAEHLGEHFG